jgi:hypothetical protein
MSAASEPTLGAEESEVHTARKEGREVVTMRSFAEGDSWIVECDVYPVTGMRVDPLRPGPYRFPSRELADVFVGEATKALSELGCELD